jgi:hypothetical protein
MENLVKGKIMDIVSDITNNVIDEAYDKRISKMTKYEKEIFNMCIQDSPNTYDTKEVKLQLISVIKKQKITKKKLEEILTKL